MSSKSCVGFDKLNQVKYLEVNDVEYSTVSFSGQRESWKVRRDVRLSVHSCQ